LLDPTPSPQLKVNDDARAKLALTRDALNRCNWDKASARKWYEEVAERHARGKS
jgi:hypothetical protein